MLKVRLINSTRINIFGFDIHFLDWIVPTDTIYLPKYAGRYGVFVWVVIYSVNSNSTRMYRNLNYLIRNIENYFT